MPVAKGDMVPPSQSEGMPQPIRQVRRDMVSQIASDDKISILDTENWIMARSTAEKKRLVVDNLARPEILIVAWGGTRWTDFFEFPEDERIWDAMVSALTPRRSVMLTEDELEVIRAHREGDVAYPNPRPTGRRTAKRKT